LKESDNFAYREYWPLTGDTNLNNIKCMTIDLRNKRTFDVSKDVYGRTDISRIAKAVYISLCFYSSEGDRPDIEAMSILCGYNPRTFYRALRELTEKQIIKKTYSRIDLLQ